MTKGYDNEGSYVDNDFNNNTNIEPGVIMTPPPDFNSSTTSVITKPDMPPTVLGRWKTRFRFLLAVITMLCLTSVWSNIIAFNFAMVCLSPHEQANGSHEFTDDKYPALKGSHFTSNQKTYLTSAVAIAALFGNLIAVQLITKYGVRSVFTPLGLLSGIVTALFPLGLKSGFITTLILRCLQGIAFSANFPVIGAFTSKWAYYKQSGFVVSTLVAYIQLSPTLSDPISGALCDSELGWESIFYGHALVCLILFSLFGIIFRNSPGKHPFVGHHELYKVTVNKPIQSKEELRKIPYMEILKTPAVWAIWLGGIGNFFCVNAIFLFSPNYFHYVLKMDIQSTGSMSAVPAILQFLVKLSGGITSDKVRCVGETNKLRLYNSLAFLGAATGFIVLSFVPSENSLACFIILSVATGFLGLTTGGFFKAGPLIAQQYSQFVTGNISQAITTTMIIVPFVIGGLAPHNSPSDWQHIFWVIAAVLIAMNAVFCIFCSAKPAEWTKVRSTNYMSDPKPASTTFASATIGKIYPSK